MDRSMFGVNGHEFCARRSAGCLNDGPSGDQRFFVGQRKTLATLQGCEGDRKAGETNDGVDGDVGSTGAFSKCVGPRTRFDLEARSGESIDEILSLVLISDGDE